MIVTPHQRAALRLLAAHGTLRASVLGRLVGHSPSEAGEFARRLRARGLVALDGGARGHSATCALTAKGRAWARNAAAGAALLLAVLPAVAEAHGMYGDWRSNTGVSCCHDRDCRPVDLRYGPDGKEEIRAEGRWWPVEQDKVLPLASPDGQAHACWQELYSVPPDTKPNFLCIVLPGYASLEPDPGPALAWLEDAAAGLCRGRP